MKPKPNTRRPWWHQRLLSDAYRRWENVSFVLSLNCIVNVCPVLFFGVCVGGIYLKPYTT